MMTVFSTLATVMTYGAFVCCMLSLYLIHRNGLGSYPGLRVLLLGLAVLMVWLIVLDASYDFGMSQEDWSAWRRNVGRFLLFVSLAGFCLDLCLPHEWRKP